MPIKVLSFFTGGGFLDIGFESAGFDIAWTNEYNSYFAQIYAYGMTTLHSYDKAKAYRKWGITNTKSIESISKGEILREAFDGSRPEFFGMIGGPPCPDFSNGGKHAGGSGKNGRLTQVFVEKICEVKPDFFLIENVSGLYKFTKHRQFLHEQLDKLVNAGYLIDYKVLNALDFGVPQTRERIFVIGFRKKHLLSLCTHGRCDLTSTSWFPWPKPAYHEAKKTFSWPEINDFGVIPKRPGNIPIELTVWHAFNSPCRCLKLPNGLEFFQPHSDKFQTVSEGDVSKYSFKRLHRYRYSPTAWYGHQEVHLHPWEPRRLSVREAMRLQTIPDEYLMPEEINLSAKFKLIGNGVPCMLAHRIALAIKAFIKKNIKG